MKVTKEQTTELFSRALANAQGAGVKLILLSGDSDEKSEFVESCFSSFPFVRVNLGTELSRHLVESMSFSPGMETASFMRDIHSGEPLFCTHLEILFDSGMEVDPITVLKSAARCRIVCVDWPGRYDTDANELLFGDEEDVAFRSFPVDSETIVLDESGLTTSEAT